ncbi:MAG: DUF4838 domain-containing protein [Planctomycetales bacterium]|nr:DUF4838 domain-containing protein [Planctomycetales bacterium]
MAKTNAKFCVSNSRLRQVVVDDAVRELKGQPERDSISMDPSDGGGWCECEACRAMGSASDRALTLANEVAVAINDLGLGEKYVGMYAYNEHSPPPSIRAHPNVVISVATAFIRGGYSIEQLVSGWQSQGAVLGIRDYHDVFAWSHDLPRSARGGNIEYLTRMIPWFYEHGSRFMNSENMDSWGANGLGYWLTPQLLWDVGNADRVDMLIEDFLDSAFGAAKEPMRSFYELINRDHKSVRSHQDVVARMYRDLEQARALTLRSTLEEPMRLGGRWDLYFYVPRGTTVVGGYTDSTLGNLLDGDNKVVFDFGTMSAAGYFSVPVPERQDGKLWKFSNSRGSRALMTVPPYLATSVETLLLPREIVESDSQ